MDTPRTPFGAPITPAYLRPREAAAYLRIGLRTLHEWVRTGRLSQPYRPSATIALFDPVILAEDIRRLSDGGAK